MPITSGVRVITIVFIVVPSVAGMLAAILFPAYQDHTTRAKIEEALSEIPAIRTEIERAASQGQSFRIGTILVASPYVRSAEVGFAGTIIIKLVPRLAGGGTIVFKPSKDSEGKMSWRCSSFDVAPKYLPRDCRP